MSYLKYFTIANESPQGKPRVFLACHPDDFDRYSGVILRDLFSVVNCAVYYMDPDQSYDMDELRVDLSQMQLFVFAVTKKLLGEPNMAMDELFLYAEKEHIPVLPLLQEADVPVEDFGKRFGDLQFLGRSAITSTSISFEDQLNKYLTSVLVDDALAQKVRDAFDAYIFLSYRKKDRAHAQELMRLIHKNDFCRDVAIWYDEFLVPGENFNDSIKEMLQKSDLFALAVTPNLVNEENYVMTTEYPDAVGQNKTIAAFEMVPTHRAELEKYYDNIPECTDPRDSDSLAKALSDALGRMSLRAGDDSDTDHLYYIGLAYLSGIDVEVDHEKAFDLISRSADGLNVEATKKLVSMYRNGEGVARSYSKAIKIQDRFVKLLEKIFEGNEGVRSSTMYASAIFELSDLYKVSKDPAKQKETLLDLISICDSYDQKWSPLFRMTAVQTLGELEAEQGNYSEAKRLFTDSLEQFRGELDRGATAYAPFFTSGCILLASLCRKYGEDEEAKRYCREAIDTADKYSDSSDFVSAYLSAYNLLGGIAMSEGDLKAADGYYDRVEDLYRSLQQAGRDVSSGIAGLESSRAALRSEQAYQEDLRDIYLDYGANISSDYEQDRKDFLKMQERIKEKREAKKQNIDRSGEVERRKEVLESLKDKADSSEIEDRRKVADAHMSTGMAQQEAGQYDEAERSFLTAYEFYEGYIKERPDPEARVMMIGILSGLSEVLWNRDKKDEAIRYYERLVVQCEDLASSRGNVRDYEVLAAGCSDLASRLKAAGRIEEAREKYLDAIDAAERMVETDPGRHQRELLAGLYYDLAYLEVDPNNFIFGGKKPDMEALAYAYEIYTQLSSEYPGDNKIMNEMNRITASFMMNGVMLSDIDEMIKNKKPLRAAKPKKEERAAEKAGPADSGTAAKEGGGFFGKLFGRK